jgi:hypothetical protein
LNYQRIYAEFIASRKTLEPGLVASGQYKERHHIVPRSMGGSNAKDNLIWLTAGDHFFAHEVLARVYGGKMWIALGLMAHGNSKSAKNITVNHRTYAAIRRRSVIEVTKLISGDNHWLKDESRKSKWVHVFRANLKKAVEANIGENNVMHRKEVKAKISAAHDKHRRDGTGVYSEEARRLGKAAHNTPEYIAGASQRVSGEKNPMHGRSKDKNPNSRSVRCIETGVVFSSAKAAAEWCGVEVNRACSYGIMAGGYHWERVGTPSPQVKMRPKKPKDQWNAHRRKVIICLDTNEIFRGLKEASAKIGTTNLSRISNAIRKNATAGGYRWAYA